MKLDDPRWKTLEGGYKIPYDPTPALRRLESGEDVWTELWENLHHQGDVGVASYAAVPHLVRIGKTMLMRDWHLYALLSTIEVERHRKTNPEMPDWLKDEYVHAWGELFQLARGDLEQADDPMTIRAILGVLALAKGALKLGALISNSDTSEIDEILEHYDAWSEVYNDRKGLTSEIFVRTRGGEKGST